MSRVKLCGKSEGKSANSTLKEAISDGQVLYEVVSTNDHASSAHFGPWLCNFDCAVWVLMPKISRFDK